MTEVERELKTRVGSVHASLIMNSPLGLSLGGRHFCSAWYSLSRSDELLGKGGRKKMFSRKTRVHPRCAAMTARTVLTRFVGLEKVFAKIRVPTHFLMGAEDKLYPVEKMKPYARLVPQGTIEIIPSCGHLAPIEAHEAVAAAISKLSRNFVNEVWIEN